MRLSPLLLCLTGCWYLDDERFQNHVQDYDGDGGIAERFGGPDCVDDDPTIADCDADDDGFRATAVGGDDCDDHDAATVPGVPWFGDGDGDGYGGPDDARTGCGEVPAGWSLVETDCDDENAAISPAAAEACDDLDRNCDGDATRGASDAAVQVYPDGDGDGYGIGSAYPVCTPGSGESTLAGDCDDGDGAVFPGAPEILYDGIDQDCVPENEFDADSDGIDHLTDCDDTNAEVYPADGFGNPGAPEYCDGADNDCDGLTDDAEADVDQALGSQVLWFVDLDGDGFAGDTQALFCPGVDPGVGFDTADTDCDDGRAEAFPGAVEWCNAFDDDCNGAIDEGTAIDAFTAYLDQDGDGFGGQPLATCSLGLDVDGDGALETLSVFGDDCNDALADTYPGASEVCGDSVRQDCSDLDPDDCDGDGFLANDPDPSLQDCADGPGGEVTSPDAPELCDGVDNDCDLLVDSDDPSVEPVADVTWYRDADADGQGSAVVLASATCDPPAFGVRNADDCDDTRAGVYLGAEELCDSRDNDCDGETDENAPSAPTFYFDGDGDGSGDPSSFTQGCSPPVGAWVGTADDCDDSDGARGPLLAELCDDGIDNDCDGLADAADPDADALTGQVWYPDTDGDGVGTAPGIAACTNPDPALYVDVAGDCDDADASDSVLALWYEDRDGDGHGGTLGVVFGCRPDTGTWFPAADDCNDTNAGIFPLAVETCDLVDQDCDGAVDEAPLDGFDFFLDGDGDGDAPLGATATVACEAPGPGWVATAQDCDDADAARSSLAIEDCDDGIDNDCDLQVDAADTGYALFDPAETEPAFLATALGADHALLLDLHNLMVLEENHGFRAEDWLARAPLDAVVEVHVAGGSTSEGLPVSRRFRLDSHDHRVPERVWQLLNHVLPHLPGLRAVTLERLEGTVSTDDVASIEADLSRARIAVAGWAPGPVARAPAVRLPAATDVEHRLFDAVLAEVFRSPDPPATLTRRLGELPAGVLRDAAQRAAAQPDGLRLTALLVAQLRFSQVLRGSRVAEQDFDADPAAFTARFRRYHHAVRPTAFDAAAEAALWMRHPDIL